MTTVDEYLRFGRLKVRGRSPAYERLCQAVAGDRALVAALETLPEPKRQPNLLFAAVRHLGGPVLDAAAFLDWTTERFADVAAPEQEHRLARLRAAVAVARADPPLLVRGDLRTDLPGLAAQAPHHSARRLAAVAVAPLDALRCP